METLQQMFMPVIAAFAFLILIAKFVSAAINGDAPADHHHFTSISDPRHVLDNDLKSSMTEKGSSKRKSTKKVRFAVDHDEFADTTVVNKAVVARSETKSIVFEKDRSEVDDCGNEIVECDESVSNCVDQEKLKGGEIESVEETVICEENAAKCMKLLCDDGIDEAEKEKEGLISEEDDSSDDDWEGVERSDLEKVFVTAADYCKVDDNLQSLESDIQMQLYALHKVATEGPCHEAQPMALKVSARAKWNSWQKLGNMNPDVAMEKYIALVSELAPGWSQGIHSFDKH
ncbi:hypothetical protein QVD17_10345 [Tagetes erecta]|uniref:ACB domain-containing protein n=1 Tax=Tagetes erecta TaxID=13708 RepID=A0AAD8L945_TARER|nr:hypothetical protein QVD17_10345 [Tagetes erecta]